MIILFTDFGIGSPYQAQLHSALHQAGCQQPIIDLHADLACYQIRPAAYLLAAYVQHFPPGSIFVCVVDPGVGSRRRPLVLNCADRWFVGPDNGLFDVLPQHFDDVRYWDITWQPETLSNTFHGRDLFAPTAARLSLGDFSGLDVLPIPSQTRSIPADVWSIIYIDHYGNLYTGVRLQHISSQGMLELHGQTLSQARTYSEVPEKTPFFYQNSIGLLEIAVNQGHAAHFFNAQIGDEVSYHCSVPPVV